MPTTLDRAVEADEIVGALRGYGFTQADVARAVGVSDRAVRNWSHETTTLRRRHEERLQTLRQIVLLLSDSLTQRGVGQWFRAHNRMLGGRRPLDVLADGDADAVRRAAAAFADGAYV
jgi:transcriptional regulator with XRE-family HTH domain